MFGGFPGSSALFFFSYLIKHLYVIKAFDALILLLVPLKDTS